MDHCQRDAIPDATATADIPGDVELVALWTHGRTVGSLQRATIFFLVERMQESDYLFLFRPHIELHHGGAIGIATAMRPRNVVEIPPCWVGIERGDVTLTAYGGRAELAYFLGLGVEGPQERIVSALAGRHRIDEALRCLLCRGADTKNSSGLDRRAALFGIITHQRAGIFLGSGEIYPTR